MRSPEGANWCWGVWLTAVLWVFLGGCSDQPMERLRAEHNELQKANQALRNENDRLEKQQRHLQSEIADASTRYENLEARHAQLHQWSQQLAERFGPGVWYFGSDERPLPHRSMADAGPHELVHALNDLLKTDDLPEVTLLGTEGPIAFVRIRDDDQLTQAMGSTGAMSYIQVVTYTLCSLPDITAVDFAFEAGDHAVPGRYTR